MIKIKKTDWGLNKSSQVIYNFLFLLSILISKKSSPYPTYSQPIFSFTTGKQEVYNIFM